VYPPGASDVLAARLTPFVNDRSRLLEAQTAAWTAGRERYNWDHDAHAFLEAFGRQRLPDRMSAAAAR
jgi:hypothetical protein